MGTIERSTYFTSLPREYYRSPEIYELELERVWGRQWLYFAHESELADPGSYLTRRMAGEGVIVVRGDDGELRAFLNVCRHRGSCLHDSPKGTVRRFVCPYHQWTYSLEGRLVNAPSIPDDESVDYEDWGLLPVRLRSWRGFVFINLDEDATDDPAPELDAAGPGMAALETRQLKQAHVTRYDFGVNWKVLLENYLECYHCSANHPELCQASDVRAGNELLSGLEEPAPYIGLHLDFRPGQKSLTMDGDWASQRLLGRFAEDAGGAEGHGAGVAVIPSLTSFMFQADYGVVQEIRPVDVGRVEFVNRWFVHADAVEGEDYELDRLLHVWDVTNQQDKVLCERVQEGIASRRYTPGPISPRLETTLRSALLLYLEMMEANVG